MKYGVLFAVFMVLVLPIASLVVCLQLPVVFGDDLQLSIDEANVALKNAFSAVVSAKGSGCDVADLLVDLNYAGSLVADAENAYGRGDFVVADFKADSALQIAHQVQSSAENFVGSFELDVFWVAVVFSIGGSVVLFVGLMLVWRRFRVSFGKDSLKLKNIRLVFIVVGLVGVLLFSFPALTMLRSSAQESFSTIYILGPDHLTNSIPSEVEVGTSYTTYLGVENRLGYVANYVCLVKLANDSDVLPDSELGSFSTLPVLYKFNLFLDDGQNWEKPLTFQLNHVNYSSNHAVLESITLNGEDFSVNKPSQLDVDSLSYYYGVIVELWTLNELTMTYEYLDQFVCFYINVD
jgi:hypothetical protein